MKYAIGLVMLASTITWAQPPGGREGGFFRFNVLLSALDTDKDGALSEEEIAAAPKSIRTLDKNGDGKTTADELRPAMGGPRGGGERAPAEASGNISAEMVQALLAFDADGDGKLSAKEVPERFQGLFARCDANKDGFLTKEELTASATATTAQASRPMGGPERGRGGMRMDPVLAALDANGDGALSAEEIDAAPAALKKLDKNGDGRITEDEVRPAMGPRREGPPQEEKK